METFCEGGLRAVVVVVFELLLSQVLPFSPENEAERKIPQALSIQL